MVFNSNPLSDARRSHETGHSKRTRSDSFDEETLRGLASDPVPKSGLIEEDIRRGVQEELKIVKSDVKQLRKELKRQKSQLAAYVDFRSWIRDILTKEVVPAIHLSLEDTCRRAVREELKSSQFAQPVRSSGKCLEKDEVRSLQLQFVSELPIFVYTEDKLKLERSHPFDVKLVNANTGSMVISGPESSVKLKVVVLEGGFETGDDNWTCEKFEQSVVKERKLKGALLVGSLVLTLNEGTGMLGDVVFTDNSSWTSSGQFRIGFQASPEYCENIREAITKPITVKDSRGKGNEKHRPPLPNDDLWRLEHISKNGTFCKKLNDADIYTVKQFLQQLNMDPKELREILGKNMKQKKWDSLVDHAKTCPLNGERHAGHDNEKFSLEQKRKSSSSFPSQISGGQIQIHPPVPHNLAPRICAAPVGPEAPPVNAGSIAAGHYNAVTAGSSQVQSQNTNHGDAMESAVNGPPSALTSSCEWSGTRPRPGGDDDMKYVPYDAADELMVFLSQPIDHTSFQTPPPG